MPTATKSEILVRQNPSANILIEVGLVTYGYQLDIQCERHKIHTTVCRDFGGDYQIKHLEEVIHNNLIKFFKDLEKNYLRNNEDKPISPR